MSHPLALEAVQWSLLEHIDDVSPLDESDACALEEIRHILKKHHKLDRFGVCLLHKHFEIGKDEIALEQTDGEARISTIRIVPRAAVNLDSIETAWRFDDDGAVCFARCVPEQGH